MYLSLKIVEVHSHFIPSHIERIKKQNCSDTDRAGDVKAVKLNKGYLGSVERDTA